MSHPDPNGLTATMASPIAKQWLETCREEYASLLAKEVFKPVHLPQGEKAVGCRWVFRIKHLANGLLDRYKSRLCALGYSQRPDRNYTKVFAPTC